MASIDLLEELHANTRRTRITYKARVSGQWVAVKCYRKPFFGLFHWWRAKRRGQRIRSAGARFPDVVFSGWVPSARCFGFGTEFLQGSESFREVLRDAADDDRRLSMLGLLGEVVAELHNSGIVQPDGNLTNFLLDRDEKVWVIDEDDVMVCSRGVPAKVAMRNLANISSRISDQRFREVILRSYLGKVAPRIAANWQLDRFWREVDDIRHETEAKWRKRNIPTDREFD